MLPRWATESNPEDAASDERIRCMTPEERLALFLELCDLTDSIVGARPDSEAIRAPTPRSAASEALWRRLMATYRRVGSSR